MMMGLYGKYTVTRHRDHMGKHDRCTYFVLDPRHDPVALKALRVYAKATRNAELKTDLWDWIQDLEGER